MGILLGPGVRGTDMSRELLVALQFIVYFHLVNGFANQRPFRVENPGAFGASPALKIRSFGPYYSAALRLHGHLAIWCAYTLAKDGAALVFDGTAAATAVISWP
jgi:hypothetical protein